MNISAVLDIFLWTFGSFLFHYEVTKTGLKYLQERTLSYIISSLHATTTTIFHLYMIQNYQPLGNILAYHLMFSYSLGYYLNDMNNFAMGIVKHSHVGSIILHHIIVMPCITVAYYMVTYHPGYLDWYFSLLYLGEASTPLLNYIQYHKGEISRFFGLFFIFVYFVCRPLNMTYLLYKTQDLLEPTDILSIGLYVLTALNYYWFYKIYLKAINHR